MELQTERSPLQHRHIIGMRVDATSYEDATERIIKWAQFRAAKRVCAANVHMAMETYDDPKFAEVVNYADLVTPDGMPLVWGLRALGIKDATRVCGPSLTLMVCEAAARHKLPIALYGGTPESLVDLTSFLLDRFPEIEIACQISPPFRELTPAEDTAYTEQIVASGARILFVGIGCPRQEIWMARHQDRIPAVMLGVGAAFNFYSGRVKHAPLWMQKIGLEWFFRLLMEPRRLWKRYLKQNPRFIFLFLQQLILSSRIDN
ncbi:WecB/TagA/CpsF family glycosyltransferase [Chamaesiphon minutus]|uniref:Exopolysaccharide biosynthesis protein, WecB/TagA/CpsF family n=1 Tax=Chamaesiphon minutus (strain ATCC 27169 / PCC 6605) TaxID=1173020 RepID=K9UGV5_CHAP6|nr:WecB/TagA/CpsF family glycosyltransferase [Chamaesiphon minutus]AFY93873.1 exopolysaccharide biosynthesis protein, WecB/TagA/CpsF family [Chamaesiphon minutus PCC 6605]